MGILFNILIIYPLRRLFGQRDVEWQARKDAGEDVGDIKPSTGFLLVLVAAVIVISIFFI